MMMMMTTTTIIIIIIIIIIYDLNVLDLSKPPSQRNQTQTEKCTEH
jgi:hypothetical protein